MAVPLVVNEAPVEARRTQGIMRNEHNDPKPEPEVSPKAPVPEIPNPSAPQPEIIPPISPPAPQPGQPSEPID